MRHASRCAGTAWLRAIGGSVRRLDALPQNPDSLRSAAGASCAATTTAALIRKTFQRQALVECVEQAHVEGMSWQRIAEVLHRSPRTLRAWRHVVPRSADTTDLRGRPVLGSTVAERNRVIRFLHHVTGPAIGLPALRAVLRHAALCAGEPAVTLSPRVARTLLPLRTAPYLAPAGARVGHGLQ